MNAIVEFMYDPESNTQPVRDLIVNLMEEGIGKGGKPDDGKLQLFKLVQRGLEFLETHGLPEAAKRFFVENLDDGKPYTILLVKKLIHHPPLFEFRVNWQGIGAFRTVFFEFPHPRTDQQILLFIRAMIKQSTYDEDFEKMVAESDKIYLDFLHTPEKYITFSEE